MWTLRKNCDLAEFSLTIERGKTKVVSQYLETFLRPSLVSFVNLHGALAVSLCPLTNLWNALTFSIHQIVF